MTPAQLGLICTESNACDISMAFDLRAGQGKCTLCSRNTFFPPGFCFFWKIYPFSPSTLMLLRCYRPRTNSVSSHQSLALNHKTVPVFSHLPCSKLPFPLRKPQQEKGINCQATMPSDQPAAFTPREDPREISADIS